MIVRVHPKTPFEASLSPLKAGDPNGTASIKLRR